MNQIKRYEALLAVLFGLFVWGCSGEETNGNGTVAHGSATQIEETGGTMNETGGTGGDESTGGTVSETGGSDSTGGNQPTGGSAGEAGSLVDETGGTPSGGSAGNPTETGGVEATGGDESTGGSDPSTGGQESTGGSQETGGAQATGGVEETGGTAGSGSNPETGGTETGGVEATGGLEETGGVEATGGSQETGGAGGVGGMPACANTGQECEPYGCCNGNCYRGYCVDEMPQELDCSDWTREESFLSGLDLGGDLWASSPNDIYTTTSTGLELESFHGDIVHYDGSSWSVEPQPLQELALSHVNAICGTDDGVVWAGGQGSEVLGSSSRGKIMRKEQGGDWQLFQEGITWESRSLVTSMYCAGNEVFAVTEFNANRESWNVKILRWSGEVWSEMTLTSHTTPTRIRTIWGYSADNLFAVGGSLDVDAETGDVTGWADAILWHFDGSVWSDWSDSLPSDVVVLADVHGNTDGEIFVVGDTWDGEYRGIVLSSMDWESWDRFDSATEGMSSVWSPALGSVIATGAVYPQGSGSARTIVASNGVWGSEDPLDNIAEGATEIFQIPGTTTLLQLTQGYNAGEVSVYRADCQ